MAQNDPNKIFFGNLRSVLKYKLVFSLRTEDPVVGGMNPVTWTTRTNLTSVTVRIKHALDIMCHYVKCHQLFVVFIAFIFCSSALVYQSSECFLKYKEMDKLSPPNIRLLQKICFILS